MRSFLLLLFLLNGAFSQAQNSFDPFFDQAYANHPTLLPGVLEAVAWTNTRMVHLDQPQEGCSGYPIAYGIMGLHDDGKNYFFENGTTVAALSGIPVADQKSSASLQIEAYAHALEFYLQGATDPASLRIALHQLSEIPDTGLVNLLARDMQVYEVLRFMTDPQRGQEFGFGSYHFNLPTIFGADNYEVLRSKKIAITETGISSENGHAYAANANASLQYGPAIWNPASNCNYSSRSGVAISAITIHTIQGSYAGAISWAQNCSASVSYHYVIRSSDGQVTQMVLEEDKAWHVGSENPYTIGYEHEGYVDNPIWYTEAMYNASADLSRDVVNSGYGIPALRTYFGPSSAVTQPLGACTRIKGHQHYPNQTHTDPGINWNWEKYYRLINNNPAITTISSTSGTLTDSGGPTGNYGDDERNLWLIAPTNASTVTLNFTSFDLEINYDYLFIYDGDSIGAPLIGQYSGTASPGSITSSGATLLLEFRSDCGTTASGWIANYTSVPQDNLPPATNIVSNGVWQTTDFTVDFVDTDAETSIKERYYLVSEKEIFENAPHSSGLLGFANESFADNANNWLAVTGSFTLQTETFVIADTNQQNSNVYFNLNQSNAVSYLYEWDQTITSAASNQRAGIHFFCDDATQSNRGNSYFVYLRANDDRVQIYSVANNVFTLEVNEVFTIDENVAYKCRVHYDPISGWIRAFVDGQLAAEWQDLSPLQAGNAISLRTGGCSATFDNVRVYQSRGTQVVISAGFGQTLQIESEGAVPTGMVYSLVTDSLDNWSPVAEELYLLDFTAPEILELNDGPTQDIDTLQSTTIAANWSAQDIHSGIQEFEIAIGTTPNSDDVAPWSSNGLTASYSSVLAAPIYDQVYYISIRALNQAGLDDTLTSDGQRYIDDLAVDDLTALIIDLYPNPATEFIQISGTTKEVSLMIYDINGKLCHQGGLNSGEKLSISTLSAGNYSVVVRQSNEMVVKKLIVLK